MAAPIPPLPPPSLWDYAKLNFGFLGFWISLVLAVVKGYEIYNSRRDRSRDQRTKVNDAWFKAIVFDAAIPDIRKFIETHRSSLQGARISRKGSARPFMAAWQRFQPESEELMTRLLPVEELSTHAYAKIVSEIEKFADNLLTFCSRADDASNSPQTIDKEWMLIQQQMDGCFRESLSVLRVAHLELSRGRDPDAAIAV
jgi:hypothetical protein